MSLVFGGASSDHDAKSSPNVITAVPSTFAGFGWFKVTTLTSQKCLLVLSSGSAGGQWLLRLSGTSGDLEARSQGSGSNMSYITNTAPLGTLNKWYFVAFSAVFGTSCHIYVGDEYTLCTEATYGTTTNGASQAAYNATAILTLGNNGFNNTAAFQGKIGGACGCFNAARSLAEFQYLQTRSRLAAIGYGQQLSGGVGLWLPGYETGSTTSDKSGNSNDLTISGPTIDDDVPFTARPVSQA